MFAPNAWFTGRTLANELAMKLKVKKDKGEGEGAC